MNTVLVPETRRPSAVRAFGVLSGALLLWACGGCGGPSHVMEVDKNNFDAVVLQSDQPVLIDFYKEGCPVCAPLDPTMEQLGKEYAGRARIAHFMIMTGYWTFPAPEIKKQYDIVFVPTVILFNKGVEVKRWAVVYAAAPYRQELDKVLANPAATNPESAGIPPAK